MGDEGFHLIQRFVQFSLFRLEFIHLLKQSGPFGLLGLRERLDPIYEQIVFCVAVCVALHEGRDISCKRLTKVMDQAHAYDLIHIHVTEFLFTAQELYDLWKGNNHYWYLAYANAPQTEHVMPFTHKNLLKNIIETADTVTTKQATLRFGHDTIVLPIACLLELGNSNASIDNLDELDTYFRNYEIIPYAGNVQLIFYRPVKGKKGDILVKALLNEREVTMPASTDNFPYYKWSELREYYLNKLNN